MTTLELHKKHRGELDDVDSGEKLPSWIKFLISVLLTAFLTGLLTTWAQSSGQDVKIDGAVKAVTLKADKDQVDKLERRMERIEIKQDQANEKLDKLIGRMEKSNGSK